MMNILILTAVLLPVVAGAVLIGCKKLVGKALDTVVVAVTAVVTLSAAVLLAVGTGASLSMPFVDDRLGLLWSVDGLGGFFGALVGIVWLMVTLFALPYMKHEGSERRFYSFMLITLGAVVGVGYSGNILTLYLCFELMTLASAPMVMHSLTHKTKQAAAAYLVYSVLGATAGLFGAIFFTVNAGKAIPAGSENLWLAMGLVAIVGFCCKAGLAPFHVWLPLAHPVAPAPASAVLSGIITKCGAVAAIRVLYGIVGVDLLRGSWVQYTLVTMALVTILLGSTLAYTEKLLKKRLAYSSVSQLSYLLLGVFLMTEAGLLGALLQMLFHALAKVVLFLCAGAIILLLHRHRVDELDGAGRKLPIVMGCFAVASLSLVGIPPLGGAVSKWHLAVAGLQSGLGVISYLIPVVLIVSALLTALYLLSVVQGAFWKPASQELGQLSVKTPWQISVPLVVLSSGLLLLGLLSGSVVELLKGVVAWIV